MRIGLSLLLACLACPVTACVKSTPAAPGPLSPPARDSGTDAGGSGELLVARRVDVLVTASAPARVLLRVTGDLPSACSRIADVAASRSGHEIVVTITTARGSDPCAEVLVRVQKDLWLDGGFEPGNYVVKVNGLEHRFSI